MSAAIFTIFDPHHKFHFQKWQLFIITMGLSRAFSTRIGMYFLFLHFQEWYFTVCQEVLNENVKWHEWTNLISNKISTQILPEIFTIYLHLLATHVYNAFNA